MPAFVALNVRKARAIGPSPALVARMKSMLAVALVDDLSPESWAAVARAIAYGSTQLVEDLIVGTGESLTRAWGERFVAAVRDAYEHAANGELTRVKSSVRIFLSKAAPDRLMERGEAMRAERKPGKTNRFTGVPHSDEFIRRQAASLVVRVSRDQRQAIRESLLARYSKERRPETLVRDLKNTIGLDPRRAKALRSFEDQLRASGSKNVAAQVERYRKELLQNRAETIARTESSAIENTARNEAWAIAVDEGALPIDAEKEWVATPDACPTCRDLDGVRVGIGESFPGGIDAPPAHPNCVLGDALVSAVGALAVMERCYNGEIVVISTAAGSNLSVTPNHPILTDKGWVAAHALCEGDNVLRYVGREFSERSDNEDRRPAEASEFAQAFRQARKVSAVEVPVAAPDFHGDGGGSEVAVVYADRDLVLGAQPERTQASLKAQLQRADVADVVTPVSKPRALLSFFSRCFSAARRLVGVLRDVFAVQFFTQARAVRLGFFHSARHYPCFEQVAAHARSRDSVAFAQYEFGNAAGVESQSFRRQWLASCTQDDASFLQLMQCAFVADTKDFGERLQALASAVASDKIISVKVKAFHGHVYNLQTVSGAYISNSLISHNCYCGMVARSF